jgi:hypothetical protein
MCTSAIIISLVRHGETHLRDSCVAGSSHFEASFYNLTSQRAFLATPLNHLKQINFCVYRLNYISYEFAKIILSRVGVTYKTGFGLDDWIYGQLRHSRYH